MVKWHDDDASIYCTSKCKHLLSILTEPAKNTKCIFLSKYCERNENSYKKTEAMIRIICQTQNKNGKIKTENS